jgi:hypothetical protein
MRSKITHQELPPTAQRIPEKRQQGHRWTVGQIIEKPGTDQKIGIRNCGARLGPAR